MVFGMTDEEADHLEDGWMWMKSSTFTQLMDEKKHIWHRTNLTVNSPKRFAHGAFNGLNLITGEREKFKCDATLSFFRLGIM